MITEEQRARRKEYLDKNAEHIRARRAAYRAAHKDAIAAYRAAYYAAHKEKGKYDPEYYARTAEARREQKRAWHKTEAGRRHVMVETARRRAAGGISAWAVADLQIKSGGICPYCYQPITKGSVDHVIPVVDGGTNAADNLLWCCLRCNARKQGKSLLQYLIPLHEKNGAWVR